MSCTWTDFLLMCEEGMGTLKFISEFISGTSDASYETCMLVLVLTIIGLDFVSLTLISSSTIYKR